MLFLYRPRQTWMPYRVPRDVTQQDMYNQHLQEEFDATIRVPRQAPSAPAVATTTRPAIGLPEALQQLGALHASGALPNFRANSASATRRAAALRTWPAAPTCAAQTVAPWIAYAPHWPRPFDR